MNFINNNIDNITIYDIANNKKYKYIAKTLKDGKNVLKSSK